jgi:RNA polymerase sigma-70 factor (ECF subfamily)
MSILSGSRGAARFEPTVGRFEELVMPHLTASYNLARWLVRDTHDAEDVVQDACLRAFHALQGFQGGDGRAWMLTIVRNLCYTFLRKRGSVEAVPFDEHVHAAASQSPDPERLQMRIDDVREVRSALEQLPAPFREVLVLREMEDLSYREISRVTGLPIGTVMSRLARGRERLLAILKGESS